MERNAWLGILCGLVVLLLGCGGLLIMADLAFESTSTGFENANIDWLLIRFMGGILMIVLTPLMPVIFFVYTE